ncbi:MAG: right-handed parallel beta-helix repeat-containing protein, partial [Isosphaeraceae bacterium]|nr:right-handed parallel beta-helix repeat-containing protein [Isosphaeraceae bacterium]
MTTGRSGSPRRSSKPALPRRRTMPNLEQMEQRALLAGLVVDQIGSDPGTDGTLAFALNLATSGQTVTFDIPGAGPHVISVPATLTVPDGVTVNGYSETGASANSSAVGNNAVLLIQLDGSAGSIGLIVGTNAVVRGLSFVNFADAAVSLTGGGRISGSWVGVTTAGAGGGNATGIRVAGAGNTIGGSAAADRNLISANTSEGIELTATAATPSITNNYIGTNAAGTAALANGVGIAVDATAGVTIGAAGAGNANVISANTTAQIALGTGSHSIVNNTIGLDATGAAAPTGLAGPNDGIVITAGSNVIGGAAGSANAIGANLGAGVSISGAGATGNSVIGNAFTLTGDAAVRIAAGATGNSIGGSTSNTIAAGSTGGVVIQGTGTNTNLVVGNSLSGNAAVLIRSGAASNTIGGAGSALANSVGTGSIELTGAGTNQNLIIGNSIVAGAVGLRVAGGAASNTIGGTASDEENTISGATSAGIELTGTGTNANLVIGNIIGTSATGLRVAGGASSNTIGGGAAGAANEITGATAAGIELTGAGTSGNRVLGHDLSGLPIGIDLNNSVSGNTIGGTAAGEGNDLSAMTVAAIRFTTNASSNVAIANSLSGNTVGVVFDGDATGNTFGGANAADANTIGTSTNVHISITQAASNQVRGNSLDSSSPVGVELLANASNNIVGPGNTIASGATAAVRVAGLAGNPSSGNRIIGNQLSGGPSTVVVEGVSSGNSIGDVGVGEGNTITGATTNGVLLTGVGVTANQVLGNAIDSDGVGVLIIAEATGNTIGSTIAGGANTIDSSGNAVRITGSGTDSNRVAGNSLESNGTYVLIDTSASFNTFGPGNSFVNTAAVSLLVHLEGAGTDSNVVTGNTFPANSSDAVLLDDGASDNTIGGTSAAEGNTFSGAGAVTFAIRTAGASTGNVIAFNSISGYNTGVAIGASGIDTVVGGGNTITGNVVGISIGADDAVIGGATPNRIFGNSSRGISVGAAGALIDGNVIGLNLAGTGAGGAQAIGIRLITGSDNATIGSIFGNTISGHSVAGIDVSSADAASVSINANLIGLDAAGDAAVPNDVGIRVAVGGVSIGGTTPNTISGNTTEAIELQAANATVSGNIIGLNAAGNAARPNPIGIHVDSLAGVVLTGNTISGNTAQGILLEGGAGGTVVEGNVIGLGLDGSSVPNSIGIELDSSLTTAPTIGGTTRNTISGNTNEGILVERFSSRIRGNVIGLNAAGAARGNSIGVRVVNAIGVSIGSSTQGENVISGNTIGIDLQGAVGPIIIEGNFIGTDVAGTSAVGNMIGVDVDASVTAPVTIGGLTSNFISGNTSVGIAIGSSGHFIRNNSIGIGVTGSAVGNATGIEVTNASDIIIGAAGVAQPNVISGNTVRGIALLGGSSTNIAVRANTIGLSSDGATVVGNPIGILVSGPDGVTIGGTQLLERNVISGNTTAGIRVEPPVTLVNGTTIIANRIGLTASGTAQPTGLGATGDGIVVASPSTRIGGAGGGEGNVFGHIPGAAIRLASADASTNLTLLANSIGLAAAGNGIGIWVETPTGGTIDGSLLPANTITGNTVGIRIDSNTNAVVGMTIVGNQTGILVQGATGTAIGGSTAATRNTISGSSTAGISLQGASGSTSVVGNWIGLSNDGLTAVPNAVGILVNSTNAYTLDGATVADRNTIAGNVVGVRLQSNGHSILGMPFGLNAVGTAIGNTTAIEIRGGANNRVGGSGANQANTITGAAGSLEGVLIDSAATNNTIQSNLIDDVATGIAIRGASTGNSIGGATPPNGNTISGATGSGIEISGVGTSLNIASSNVVGTSRAGVSLAASASNNTIGSIPPGSFNILSGNSIGVEITSAATANVVAGNAIGLDSNLVTPLPNSVGVVIDGGSSNSVGFNLISANLTHGVEILNGGSVSNLISLNFIGFDDPGAAAGNGGHGVLLHTSAAANTISNNAIASSGGFGILFFQGGQGSIVSNNLIGLNVDELSARPNVLGGIGVDDTDFVTIGGAGAGNTIAGNDNNGISITSSEGVNIFENLIGLSTIGGAFANTLAGVLVDLSASDVTIGGNTIAANGTWGVDIAGPTSGTVVSGNRIGTTADGLSALPNVSGGVRIRDGAFNNSVGLGGQGNLISGHAGNPGVLLSSVSGNIVQANTVGLGAGGAALGNSIGVRIDGGSNNVVGTGNLIAGNSDAGVEITGLLATGNTVTGNTIGAPGAGNSFAGVRVVGDASLNSIASNTVGFSSSGIEIDDANDNSITGILATGNTVTGNT